MTADLSDLRDLVELTPVGDGGDWQLDAACRWEDPELFFLPDGADETLPGPAAQLAAAKAVCRRCPVLSDCLREAFASGDGGVRGATSEGERRAARRASLTRALPEQRTDSTT